MLVENRVTLITYVPQEVARWLIPDAFYILVPREEIPPFERIVKGFYELSQPEPVLASQILSRVNYVCRPVVGEPVYAFESLPEFSQVPFEQYVPQGVDGPQPHLCARPSRAYAERELLEYTSVIGITVDLPEFIEPCPDDPFLRAVGNPQLFTQVFFHLF